MNEAPKTVHLMDEEESYFVSMTDLMVGMLFIFIVLLMAFALNYRQAEQGLVGAQDARTRMLTNVEEALVAIDVRARVFPQTGILRLPEDLLFASGKAELNPEGKEILAFIGHTLRTVLPCYAIAPADVDTDHCIASPGGRLETVLIEGHTDDVPLAPNARYRDNWELSTARAIETFKALVDEKGVLPSLVNRWGNRLIAVSGYGEQRPIDSNDSEAGRRNNRRIDFRFIMSTPEVNSLEAAEEALRR